MIVLRVTLCSEVEHDKAQAKTSLPRGGIELQKNVHEYKSFTIELNEGNYLIFDNEENEFDYICSTKTVEEAKERIDNFKLV